MKNLMKSYAKHPEATLLSPDELTQRREFTRNEDKRKDRGYIAKVGTAAVILALAANGTPKAYQEVTKVVQAGTQSVETFASDLVNGPANEAHSAHQADLKASETYQDSLEK